MSRRLLLPVVGLSLIAIALHASPASAADPHPVPPRVAVLTYYGFGVAGTPSLTWSGGTNPGSVTGTGDGGIGAVQFALTPHDTTFTAQALDKSQQPAGGGFFFMTAAGKPVGATAAFCGRIPLTKIPFGSAAARVYLDPMACAKPITTGTVKATIGQLQHKRSR